MNDVWSQVHEREDDQFTQFIRIDSSDMVGISQKNKYDIFLVLVILKNKCSLFSFVSVIV